MAITCAVFSRYGISAALLALALSAGLIGERPRTAHAATFVVTTLADSGPGSLRQAIIDANAVVGADTITFSVSGFIVLATALPEITDAAGLAIDGTGRSVTVSGNGAVRPFSIGAGSLAEIKSLAVRFGKATTGGGISNQGTLTVTDSTISGNVALLQGGGVYTGALGMSSITNSTISDNIVPGYCGGGIFIEVGGTSVVTNSTIRGNIGAGNGGGICHGGPLAVIGSTVSGNRTGGGGGATHTFSSAHLTMAHSTLSGNDAFREGGGIFQAAGSAEVTNSTIAGNTAHASGGGVVGGYGLMLRLSNVVVGVNNAPAAPDCDGVVTLSGPNLISNTSGCGITGILPMTGAPKLGALADNTGPTQTHALLAGSPAIDTGDDAVCAGAVVGGKDQRGISRPQGAHCDLGAFEQNGAAPVIGGKNLRITTGSIALSWSGGTAQTGYILVRFNTASGTPTLINLGANVSSYTDATAVSGAMYCYVLAPVEPGGALLGLSDLLCGMTGVGSETVTPRGFDLTLGQTAEATMTWTAPVGGADAYLLQRIPLDGSSPTRMPLPGSATSNAQAVPGAGECFLLVAYQGVTWGASDVLCGIPGFSTLGRPADTLMQTVGEAMADVQLRLGAALPTLSHAG